MKHFICLLLVLTASVCQAAQERIVNLPEDGDKWHVSIVGDGDQYQEILAWFDAGKLAGLRDQVHFHVVSTDDPIFANYKSNIKGLPTVRVQDAVGNVIFESAAKDLPATSDGLYSAIALAVNDSEGLFRHRHRRDNVTPEPKPAPVPAPAPIDPKPQPLSDGGAPVLEPAPFTLDFNAIDFNAIGIAICVGALAFSIALETRKHN